MRNTIIKIMGFLALPFAVLHWLLFMVLQLFGSITAPILFPIAWNFRDFTNRRNNILSKFLYLYLDTLEPYGDKQYQASKGYSDGLYFSSYWEEFKFVYVWSVIRNPFWNFNYIVKLWNYEDTLRKSEADILLNLGSLTRYGIKVNTLFNTPVLKYVDEAGNYMNNRGEYLSRKYSYLGWELCVWTWKGLPYFKLSFAGRGLGADKEIQLGMNHYRYKWRIKPYLFRRKKFYEDL